MARIARVIAPGYPHHITQRGNRRQKTFFKDEDYETYIRLMSEWCGKLNVEIWGYCLMPNHVHLIAVPNSAFGLRQAIGEAHRRYTRYINFQKGWKGYLWQGRFGSCVLDQRHLIAAARYIEHNPVKAGMVKQPEHYRWSSAVPHLQRKDNSLVRVSPLLDMVPGWAKFLASDPDPEALAQILRHSRTGRPVGSVDFISTLETLTGRTLKPQKPGPKARMQN